MSTNTSQDTIPKRLPNTISELSKQVKEARTDQMTWRGYLPIPVRSSDPPVTFSGQYGLYYNSGTGKVRKSYNGSAWADTTI